jgi:hypothetical protein
VETLVNQKLLMELRRDGIEKSRGELAKRVAVRPCRKVDSERKIYPIKYLCIASAALRPAPMARMTVAEPVTMSPPA